MNRAAREEFTDKVGAVLNDIAKDLPARASIWVELYGRELGSDIRRYTKESFKKLIKEWESEGFVIKQDEGFESFYNGEKSRPKAWALDWFQIHLTDPAQHADGGNFCPYVLVSDDADLVKYCREKIQLADHIPKEDEDDLLEPCLIHAICESAKTLTGKNITCRQKEILKNSLWSRCMTRFIPVASITSLAREFSLRITIYDIEEHPLYRFSSHGIVFKFINGEWVKQENKIQNITGDKPSTLSQKQKDLYLYDCQICLWEDHYFVREAAETLRDLIDEHKLIPMKYSANDIFKQALPVYEPFDLVSQKTMFMTPKQTLDSFNYTMKNIDNESCIGYKKLLEYLCEKDINMLSMSAIPKKFIGQSVRGGKVSIANGKQCLINEPITGLDVNSLYPYSMSEIPAPLGYPKSITSKMTLADVKKKPIYFVKVFVSAYHRQHELDAPLSKGFHVFNNYDLSYLPIEVDETKGISGYYFDEVKEGAFKEFIYNLYERKVSGDSTAKAVMNKMTGMLGKSAIKTYHRKIPHDKEIVIKDHPLIKSIKVVSNTQDYEYYSPLDYVYNFTPLYSLILSKSKMHMEQLFRECHNKDIKMYCTSTDSLYIRSKDVPKLTHHIDSKALGKLKVEAEADKACFAGYRLYALGNTKIILTNQSGKEFREKHGENSFNAFVQKYFKGAGHQII